MARKKGTEVVNWQDRMAEDADEAAAMEEGIGSSNFFSLKRGKLTWNDNPVPGNELVVIVLASVMENTYYTAAYDENNPAAPDCFAFGTNEKTIAPHENSRDPQADSCAECHWNKFGTADVGRGKACRNARRLALLIAGRMVDGEPHMIEPDDFDNADIGFMKIPPTSLRGWAGYVREVKGRYSRPPYGVVTHIEVVEDDSDQFHVNFSHIGVVNDDGMPIVMERRDVLQSSGELEQPYVYMDDEEDAPKKKAPAKKKSRAKGRGASRY